MMLALRYGSAVLGQFKGTLLALLALVALGATVFASSPLPGGAPSLDSAAYAAWMALFAEQVFNVTGHLPLEVLTALYPLFGAVVVGEGVVRLGLLLMSRRQGDKEWQKVVASTYRNHVILCGLGHMGFRVLEYLRAQGVPTIVIEKDAGGRFVSKARSLKVPVLIADMKDDESLVDAQVQHARVVIAATNDDLANIEVALDARRMNPGVRIAMRQFDPEIASKLQAGFSVDFAFSSTAVAAPIIAAQALGLNAPLPQVSKDAVRLESQEIVVRKAQTVNALETAFAVKIVLMKSQASWGMPKPQALLSVGDVCIAVGEPAVLRALS
jgi:voltage-gated potassium channel